MCCAADYRRETLPTRHRKTTSSALPCLMTDKIPKNSKNVNCLDGIEKEKLSLHALRVKRKKHQNHNCLLHYTKLHPVVYPRNYLAQPVSAGPKAKST